MKIIGGVNRNASPSSSSTHAPIPMPDSPRRNNGPSGINVQPPQNAQANQSAPSSSSTALPDITNRIDNGLRQKRKRGRPDTWDEATPRHKNARVSLYSILNENGMLPEGGASSSGIASPPANSVIAMGNGGENVGPGAIVVYNPDVNALAVSKSQHHLERLSQVMASPDLIAGLYKEFCSRLAKPVDITQAWVYFVSELAAYAHSQAVASGRSDVSYEQVEDFIKQNWCVFVFVSVFFVFLISCRRGRLTGNVKDSSRSSFKGYSFKG